MKLSRLIVSVCALALMVALSTISLGQDANTAKPVPAQKKIAQSVTVGTTLENLQTAFYAESNESALYMQYAKKADEEGYGQVASMFRAIARAEEIHATAKADLIRKMGGAPKADTDPIIVSSTRENLEYAAEAETYERDVMYPEFIKQARAEKNRDALELFTLDQAAEPGHRAMFQQTLSDLEGYRGQNVQLFVCPKCGTTVRSLRDATCPACSMSMAHFEKVQ